MTFRLPQNPLALYHRKLEMSVQQLQRDHDLDRTFVRSRDCERNTVAASARTSAHESRVLRESTRR